MLPLWIDDGPFGFEILNHASYLQSAVKGIVETSDWCCGTHRLLCPLKNNLTLVTAVTDASTKRGGMDCHAGVAWRTALVSICDRRRFEFKSDVHQFPHRHTCCLLAYGFFYIKYNRLIDLYAIALPDKVRSRPMLLMRACSRQAYS